MRDMCKRTNRGIKIDDEIGMSWSVRRDSLKCLDCCKNYRHVVLL